MNRRELRAGTPEVPFLVVGQRQVHAYRGLVRRYRQRARVFLNGSVKLPRSSQGCAEVSAHFCQLGADRESLAIVFDRALQVSGLLGGNPLAQKLIGFGRRGLLGSLTHRPLETKRKKQDGNGSHVYKDRTSRSFH